MGDCKKQDCMYKSMLSRDNKIEICSYCLTTGLSRGCPVNDCTCYVPVTDAEKVKITRQRIKDIYKNTHPI